MQQNNVIEVVVALVDQITKPLAGVTKTIAGLGAVAAGGWSLNKLIANINEAEQVAVKLDIAFKNVGATSGLTMKRLEGLASELQRTTTFSDEQVKSAEALLLTFTRVKGVTFERTLKSAADLAAFMGTDIVQATRMLGFALQDPERGMMMLRRARISLTQAEREAIKTMAESGDLLGAQAKLLDVVSAKTEGAAAAFRNTLGGAITGLQNHLGDLLEGDRGSFQGAIDSINEFSTTLQDPNLKRGMDTLIAFLVDSIGLLAKAAAGWGLLAGAIANAVTAGAEKVAEMRGGSDNVIQRLNDNLEANRKLQGETARNIIAYTQQSQPGERGYLVFAQRLIDERAKLERLKKEEQELLRGRTQELQEQQRARAATAGVTPASELGFDPDAVAERFIAGQRSMRSEIEKATEAMRAEVQVVAQLYQLTDEQLAERGIKRGDLDTQIKTIQGKLDETVAKATDSTRAESARKMEELIRQNVEYITKLNEDADDVKEAVTKIEQSFETLGETAIREFNEFKEQLDKALEYAVITPERYNELLDKYMERELEPVVISARKIILPPPEDLMQPFRERVAQNLQDVFAEAFMSIGKGWDSTVQMFLDGFKRIFAEAAAMNLARAMGLDKIAAGGTGNGIIGKAIEALFPRSYATPTGGGGDPGVDGGTGPGGATGDMGCAAKCAGEVVTSVSQTMGESVAGELKVFNGGIMGFLRMLGSGIFKFFTGMLSKLWGFIQSAIAAIRAVATSSSAGSSGGWVSAIGSMFGAGGSAGGGRVPGNRPRWVGEEGPELLMPDSPMRAYNLRQLAFAGGGSGVSLSPQYNITINGAKDDKAMFGQIAMYIEKQDQKNKADIMEMLRRNGYGRMQRA